MAAVMLTLRAVAQPSQLEPNSEFMFKVELGYMPFVCNTGVGGSEGYVLSQQEHALGLDVVAGANLFQDWFVGGGVGGDVFRKPTLNEADLTIGAMVFVDADYRPSRRSGAVLDRSTRAMMFAPIAGARAGVSALMGEEVSMTPMVEVYGGVSWYYARGLRNSTLHRHSLFATLGVAYMQETVYLPVRIGWRW